MNVTTKPSFQILKTCLTNFNLKKFNAVTKLFRLNFEQNEKCQQRQMPLG